MLSIPIVIAILPKGKDAVGDRGNPRVGRGVDTPHPLMLFINVILRSPSEKDDEESQRFFSFLTEGSE